MWTVTNLAWWLVMVASASAERWRWPSASDAAEGAGSVRIDTKVQFVDDAVHRHPRDNKNSEYEEHVEHNDSPFKQPTDTEGFYNRPPGAGRYPVRAEAHTAPYTVDHRAVYPVHTKDQRQGIPQYVSDGTLDSVQYCRCVSTPECSPRFDSEKACGTGKYLCCYKRANKVTSAHSEFFNEIDDERPNLYPNREGIGGAFPPPSNGGAAIFDGTPSHDRDADGPHAGPEILVGPEGPSGQVGPPKAVVIGPGSPTHTVGPNQRRPLLVGPDGPTGIIGPAPVDRPKGAHGSASAQRGVLVGPGGPTGVIGPYNSYVQRPVLVGPGDPTGVIGTGRGGQRGVLSGPGGPTGIIGPYRGQGGRGVLVGPGGPTGTIGPGRGSLVGPRGPTGAIGPGRGSLVGPRGPAGVIGPRRYYGNYNYY